MTSIIYEENKIVFLDGDQKKILLDTGNLAANKSRYPMQIDSDKNISIPKLLADLVNEHGIVTNGEGNFVPFYLLDILATSYLFRTSVPLKVLEIGATSGILSYHLASLMGKLNHESLLCCVSDVIGNGSENHWLDMISMVEEPPKLSFLVSDYESTPLETKNFDLVVLNGMDDYDKPYETIREAKRLVKKDGILLCYVKNSPLLESCFKLVFSDREEYMISPQEMILVVTVPDIAWEEEKLPVLDEEISKLLQELRQTIRPGCSQTEIRPLIQRIDECIDIAINNFDIDKKVELIQWKEMVLNYMLNIGKELEEDYRNEIGAQILCR